MDAVERVSKLTTVPKEELDRLMDVFSHVISDAVLCSRLDGLDYTEVDIGLGTLRILHTDDELRFRFAPGAKLQEGIVTSVKDGHSTLEFEVEGALKSRLLHTYKDLL